MLRDILVSLTAPPSTLKHHAFTTLADMDRQATSQLLALPEEIVDHILSYLSPFALVNLSKTCKALHALADGDLHWARIVHENLPSQTRLSKAAPEEGWKEVYAAQYPYWFLPKYKYWFSDKASIGNESAGQLLLSRYNHRTGAIEAYRLVAEHPEYNTAERWEWDEDVMIHSFNPIISLFLDMPVLRLDKHAGGSRGRLRHEALMRLNSDQSPFGIQATLFLSRALAPEWQKPNMVLWPPRIFPNTERARNDSPSMFRDNSHKPQDYDELSETTFRIRRWIASQGRAAYRGLRLGETVMTFSTLPIESYTPTETKPYQGIWVGDYSGHGCEFLLLTQKTPEEAAGLPVAFESTVGQPEDHSDPNIPRGEYTWVSPDIGRKALIRIATEKLFKGARVVKSWGHIAASGYRDGEASTLLLHFVRQLRQHLSSFAYVEIWVNAR